MHRKNSSSIIGRMTGSLQQLANSYSCQKTEPEFELIKYYIEALTEKLLTLEKIGERINKDRKGMASKFVVSKILNLVNFWILG